MHIVSGTLEISEICNGFALYGVTPQGARVFVAHLGDGVDGLPDPHDPDLPAIYDFELVSVKVDCPQCDGSSAVPVAAAEAYAAISIEGLTE